MKKFNLHSQVAMAVLRAAVALSGILCTFIGMLFTTTIGSAFAVALFGTGVIVLLDEHLITINTQKCKKY